MVRLYTLGSIDLRGKEDQTVNSVLQQPKRLAFLVHLALAPRGEYVRRDVLFGLLWPEVDEERARNALNQAVHYLRRSLGADLIEGRGPDELRVSPARVWCDAREFEEGCIGSESAAEKALALYRGEFLPGLHVEASGAYERWVEDRRDAFRRLAVDTAWKLAERDAAADRWPSALQYGHDAYGYAPHEEVNLRRLMRLLARSGDVAAALRVFREFARRLATEFGAEPSRETRLLVEAMRTGEFARAAGATDLSAGGAARDAPDDVRETGGENAATVVGAPAGRVAGGVGAARGRRWGWAALAVVLLVASAAMVAAHVASRGGEAPLARVLTLPDPTRVAVLDFEDYSRDRELSYLAGALTNAVAGHLAGVPTLEVVSRGAVRSFVDPGGALALDSLVRALDVHLLVQGGVMGSSDQERVRVTVQLVDPATGTDLESRRVEKSLADLFALVDEVTEEVTTDLRRRIGREVRAQRWRAGTTNQEAWLLVQQAAAMGDLAAELRASGGAAAALEELDRAYTVLARAERLDPRWSEPAVLRAELAEAGGFYRFFPPLRDRDGARAQWEAGIRYADRALARDPRSAAALEARGSLYRNLAVVAPGPAAATELAAAEADLRAAVNEDGRRARAWSALSFVLVLRGEFSEANLAARRAYDADAYLENVVEILSNLVTTSLELGADDEARRWCAELRRREGRGWIAVNCELEILAFAHDPPRMALDELWSRVRAVDSSEQTLRLIGPRLEMLAAAVLARQGDVDASRAALERARNPADAELVRLEAAVRVLLGERDAAAALLAGYIAGNPVTRAGMLQKSVFAPVRDHPALAAVSAVPGSAGPPEESPGGADGAGARAAQPPGAQTIAPSMISQFSSLGCPCW